MEEREQGTRRGRPAVPEEDRLSRVYTVRFTEGEWAELEARAAISGTSKQAVLRRPLQVVQTHG